ncbi:MAG: alpha/beta fold hydrolase [Ferruginibacter sp.]
MNKRFFTTEISDPQFEKDNLRHITVRTNNLPGRGDITVYVPSAAGGQHVPIVILLHGVYGSAWCWPLKAGVHQLSERLIKEKTIAPMILAMPSDGLYRDGSAFLPHNDGYDYEKWIVEDVTDAIKQEITIASPRSALFITGLSMGGYGALRMGAKYPGLFKAFSGLSSITAFDQLAIWYENGDIREIAGNVVSQPGVLETILLNKASLPPFMFDCGDKDVLIGANRKLHNDLLTNNILHDYYEYPGEHDWNYWRTHIKEHLLFFNKHL